MSAQTESSEKQTNQEARKACEALKRLQLACVDFRIYLAKTKQKDRRVVRSLVSDIRDAVVACRWLFKTTRPATLRELLYAPNGRGIYRLEPRFAELEQLSVACASKKELNWNDIVVRIGICERLFNRIRNLEKPELLSRRRSTKPRHPTQAMRRLRRIDYSGVEPLERLPIRNAVSVIRAAEVVGQETKLLLGKLRRHGLPIGGRSREHVAELDHIIICVPEHAGTLLTWAARQGVPK